MTQATMQVEAALRAAAAEFMADRAPQLFITDEQIEREMSTNMLQCSSQWERLEFYGLPLVDDGEYYDETPVTLDLITLFTPPPAQL